MHGSVMAWVRQALTGPEVAGRRVLEVGAQDVNGSVRPDVEALGPAVYLGVDQALGPRVDQVVDATQLYATFGRDSWDVVVSTEMLEHARDWRGCLANMVSVLRPGGLLVLTTRSPGFPYHGFPEDHWRFPVTTMGRIIAEVGIQQLELIPDWDCPGVFCKARKQPGWTWPTAALRHLWAGIDIPRAPKQPMTPPDGGTERSIPVAKESLTSSPQVAGQLRQLLAERENAVAYGQTTRIEAVDKQLEALGYKSEKQAAKAADAAEERAAAAAATGPADEESARAKTPEGRTATPKVTADEAEPGKQIPAAKAKTDTASQAKAADKK
jgi:SAM-dependent methyltransferase